MNTPCVVTPPFPDPMTGRAWIERRPIFITSYVAAPIHRQHFGLGDLVSIQFQKRNTQFSILQEQAVTAHRCTLYKENYCHPPGGVDNSPNSDIVAILLCTLQNLNKSACSKISDHRRCRHKQTQAHNQNA
jgi:hypothetical protein